MTKVSVAEDAMAQKAIEGRTPHDRVQERRPS